MLLQPNMPASQPMISEAAQFPVWVQKAIDQLVLGISTTQKFAKTPKFYHTFSDKVDGPVSPMDSGQPFRIWDNTGTAAGYSISGGRMIHGYPTKATNNASYLEVPLDKKVTRIGAKVVFPTTTNSGSVALVSFNPSIISEVVDKGHSFPNAGIHATFGPNSVGVIIFKPTGSINLGTYTYPTVTAGEECTFEVLIDGNTIYIVAPDGTLSPGYTHTDVGTYSSNVACFELYENTNANTPAQFVDIWADDSGYTKNGNGLNGMDLIRALKPYSANSSYTTIDSNGRSKQITDCNSATQTGFYWCYPATPNAPASGPSFHIMTLSANALYAVQYAYRMDSPLAYKRYYKGGVWDSSWISVDASSSTYFTIDVNGYATSVTDMNNAAKTGFYFCSINTTNAPTTDAYYIFTQQANNLFAVQYAYQMAKDGVFKRSMRDGTWGVWVQINDTPSPLSIQSGNGHAVMITDANTVTVSGYYQCLSTAANLPPDPGGYAFHVISNSATYKVMYAYNFNGNTWKRYMSNGTWGAWTQCPAGS